MTEIIFEVTEDEVDGRHSARALKAVPGLQGLRCPGGWGRCRRIGRCDGCAPVVLGQWATVVT